MVGGYDYFVALVVCVLDPFDGVGDFGGCRDFSEGGELDEGFVVLGCVVCSDGCCAGVGAVLLCELFLLLCVPVLEVV